MQQIERPDAPSGIASASGWQAQIDITLGGDQARTYVRRRRQSGPLHLQRALYPETDGTCHLYLLHPPGGTVQGDRLAISVAADPGTRGLITTPAAGKLYRAPREQSTQIVQIRVAQGACVEWLPQETIVFDGARAGNRLCFDLAEDARLIAWDIVCFGRAASGERFESGLYDSAMELRIDGELHLIERVRVPGAGTSPFLDAPWGLDGQPVMGTLLAYGFGDAPPALLGALRCDEDNAARVGTSVVDGVVVVRVLGADTQTVRDRLWAAWHVLRTALLGKAPVMPRIWLT